MAASRPWEDETSTIAELFSMDDLFHYHMVNRFTR